MAIGVGQYGGWVDNTSYRNNPYHNPYAVMHLNYNGDSWTRTLYAVPLREAMLLRANDAVVIDENGYIRAAEVGEFPIGFVIGITENNTGREQFARVEVISYPGLNPAVPKIPEKKPERPARDKTPGRAGDGSRWSDLAEFNGEEQ